MTQGRSLQVDQLNSTSLKWGQDGELSPLDHQRILQLLCQSDPVAESLIERLEHRFSDPSSL
jgi:hypothetical protein